MSPTNFSFNGIDAIVIGASAGGVQALKTILPELAANASFSVLVVLHIPREQPSLLVEIFRPKCALEICEALDKAPVLPNTIYFAPEDYHLLVDKGPQLSLSSDDHVHFSRPSIDVLFESAADVYGPRLMGIILTGANQDGAAGLAAVHRCGGITIVQSPETAYAATMPASAIEQSQVDFTLNLDEIALLFRSMNAHS